MRMEYLTDDELEQLIAHVENYELVTAPPNLTERILGQIEEMSESCKEKPTPAYRDKKKEYRRYCFQVITSMAAAIAIVFLLPNLQENHGLEPPKEWKIFGASVYETKQEALNDKGMLMEVLGGFHIFNQTNQLEIFSK